jgi:hypothetical protein
MSARRTSVRARYALTADHYETPAWCVDAILRARPDVLAEADILDPCAGRGAILRRLAAAGKHARGIELDTSRWHACVDDGIACEAGDALGATSWGSPEIVIMNPPFALAEEFVRRALAEARFGVLALLRLAFLEGLSRSSLHRDHASDVYVLPRRPSFVGGRTDASAYAWFHWHPAARRRWQILSVEDGVPRG